MIETYYKIVKILGKRMVSYIVEGDARITYSTEKWSVTPSFLKECNRGPLVFDQLEAAIAFVEKEASVFRLEVWECEVQNPHEPKVFCDVSDLSESVIYPFHSCSFPEHTVECDSIKLVKCVLEKEPD